MGSRFVRRVRTTSGAVAVQVVEKTRGEVLGVEHIGSAHTDAELALLLSAARDLLAPGQQELDLGPLDHTPPRIDEIADWTQIDTDTGTDTGPDAGAGAGEASSAQARRPRSVAAGGRVVRTSALTALPEMQCR